MAPRAKRRKKKKRPALSRSKSPNKVSVRFSSVPLATPISPPSGLSGEGARNQGAGGFNSAPGKGEGGKKKKGCPRSRAQDPDAKLRGGFSSSLRFLIRQKCWGGAGRERGGRLTPSSDGLEVYYSVPEYCSALWMSKFWSLLLRSAEDETSISLKESAGDDWFSYFGDDRNCSPT